MLKKSLTALVLATSLLATSTADAALNAYLKLKGQKTGDIRGSVTQKGRENTIMVIAVEHTSGKKVLTLTKEIDKSSPLLHQAYTNGEPMAEFTLQFWRPQISAQQGVGSEVQHFTVKLTNARIQSIHTQMLNNKNPELMRYETQEEVTFTYDKIEFTWVDGGLVGTE